MNVRVQRLATSDLAVFVQADVEDAPAIGLYRSFGYPQEPVRHFDVWQRV